MSMFNVSNQGASIAFNMGRLFGRVAMPPALSTILAQSLTQTDDTEWDLAQ